jgi:hypothetical protein
VPILLGILIERLQTFDLSLRVADHVEVKSGRAPPHALAEDLQL